MTMMKPEKTTCTIHLVNGDPITFSVKPVEERLRNFGSRLEKLMDSSFIAIEIADKLIVLPTQNIQKVEISPAPTGLISNVIREVELA